MGYWCWQHEWNNYVQCACRTRRVKKKHKVAECGPSINKHHRYLWKKYETKRRETENWSQRFCWSEVMVESSVMYLHIFRSQIDWFPLRRLDLRRRPSAPDSWYLTASSHEESENFNQFRISHRWGLNSFPPRYVWICNKYDKTKKRHKSNTY